jgi:transcriptional regulator with XRE-family HTH domain
MAKKLQRVFRDRRLTPEEIAADNELRRKIETEFAPKQPTQPAPSDSLSEFLRRSIQESAKPLDQIASEAGISPIVITRFLSGERDIHMSTADRLARSLGLEVTAE